MCCTWAMHVSLTYYAGIASRVQEVFFAVLLENKFEYLLETKVANRLLLVLGVISPRAKSPFIFFLKFLFFTSHVRHFKHVFGFRSFQVRIFCLFLGEFRDNLLFLKLFWLSFEAEVWIRYAWLIHVYMTYYVVITRHVGKCRSFF